VREVTRVATPETELLWLQLAERLDMRSLERRVAGTASGDVAEIVTEGQTAAVAYERSRGELVQPAHTEWTSSSTLPVTFELSAEGWALLERALEGARRATAAAAPNGAHFSDGEALQAVARDALALQTQSPDASEPRCAVVLYECQRCGQSELDTGAGGVELNQGSAAALGCGATVYDLREEGRGVSRGGPLPAAVRRAVMLRDRSCCRVPGCHRRRYVDVHHITAQAHGGEHSRSNCLVLCTTHHRLLHEGKLSVTGNADHELRFQDGLGSLISDWGSRAFAPGGEATKNAARAATLCDITRDTPCDTPVQHRPDRCTNAAPGDDPVQATDLASQVGSRIESDHPAPEGASLQEFDQASHGGSHQGSDRPALEPTGPGELEGSASAFGLPFDPARRVLCVMGRRGGWTPDALVDASGLAASEVNVALTLLELTGRVRCRACGFDPV
jgi:DprA/Smf-like nucleotide binding protein involved in DNA uptake